MRKGLGNRFYQQTGYHTHTHKHNTLKQRRAKIFGEKFGKVLQDD